MPKYTPTEERIMDLLRDNKPHSKEKIHKCLYDDYGDVDNIRIHIHNLRKKIRSTGLDIVCEIGNATNPTRYRLVRTVGNPYRG